ncbi:MAG TPA: hypothetical protein VMI74_00210 [Burkholderiales bacterium]|nr:hypothetical protein [Burkholderiales bacterium]
MENLPDFILNVAAGAFALFCLFDGTRRLGAYGVHRRAVLLIVLSGSACALYGYFAYQRYADLKVTVAESQHKAGPAQAARWSKVASPEKKELLSQALARQNFKASGALGPYIDRNGETRTFAPNQEDLDARERVVAYYSRSEYAARASFAEALLWLIAGIVAVVLGLAMSLDKPPAPGPEGETVPSEVPLHR